MDKVVKKEYYATCYHGNVCGLTKAILVSRQNYFFAMKAIF